MLHSRAGSLMGWPCRKESVIVVDIWDFGFGAAVGYHGVPGKPRKAGRTGISESMCSVGRTSYQLDDAGSAKLGHPFIWVVSTPAIERNWKRRIPR